MRSSRRRSAGAVVCVVLTVAGVGCTRRVAPPAGEPTATALTAAQAIALVEAVNAREAGIRTMRATFSADVVRAGTTRSVTGVLVIAKPDRFRFRLMLPFGVTVYDEVRDGASSWRLTPLGSPSQSIDGTLLKDTFLPSPLEAARCEIAPPDAGTIDARCGDRHVAIRVRDATIATEWFRDQSAARYDDERSVDNVALPFRIALSYPGNVAVQVTIDRYEINPALDSQTFIPPSGADASSLD